MSNNIRLIVGLANPGPEYAHTRHNAGEWLVNELARAHNVTLKSESKFFGLTGRIQSGSQDLRLLIPTTFMNLSGKAVGAMANFYGLAPEEILVAHDELDLPPGVARFKKGGGHGGHNGLKDIIRALGNNKEFYRLRIGIGHPGDRNRVSGYVLGKAPAQEQRAIEEAIDEASRSIDILLRDGITKAQNRLHTFTAQPA
ncbi:aminoacyl-tRNA hydrolase [Ferrimonas balearica]|uniref:aminoacyl-tRNA hydrolase n=1 Tax=Ferrimonas balearica TaxID=44012 RepID=UPI001C99876B|nr:aminoacyl-tRNA hydrolase [Ferrimonas balearica]MBY5921913.1 aminoacyl-tRNA hydrolase [Ferrimonas balearica]MBY5994747.1 aminoacyl-tRNA hydrolase [Ferrimonas balearica]